MTSTFGQIFRVTTWGESHGTAIGCVVDGCPPGLPLKPTVIQRALDRRRPPEAPWSTPRRESDRVQILSGVFQGSTLGTPISLLLPNTESKPDQYAHLKTVFRPGHADYSYQLKYGRRDWRGGGRASGRETAARVAAGAIAEILLAELGGIDIVAWVDQIGTVTARVEAETVTRAQVDASIVKCPDPAASEEMQRLLERTAHSGDSIGGCIRCIAREVPAGWGEPVFDKLTARLAAAMMSIPASRGFEVGAGFQAATLLGSQHNDQFGLVEGRIRTLTNRAGGILGGISNGEIIGFRVAFKPVPSIALEQDTLDHEGNPVRLCLDGKHDVCLVPRAVPVVEAMCALSLADAALCQAARSSIRQEIP